MRSGIKFTDKDPLSYDSFVKDNDKDFQVLFHCGHQFSEVRTHELLAKLVDVVYSSAGSNLNPQYSIMLTTFSSMPLGALSSVPVIPPEVIFVASPSFAADLYCTCGREVDGTPIIVPVFEERGAPNGVEDVLRDDDDDDDDDVEPTTIADDSDDDITMSIPTGGGGASSSADSNVSMASLSHLYSR
ncbi:hypothetical protein Ahy_A07g033867 [Arachis hypogaea]|uniref:Uncharacterized protein n=1 Tax=Arachis hypogaea TaxID=3818 RepID=A0A445CAB5_ARAHY|nr:hypothetical protein Ahy_A07g033867 [Arachis hypogaea]